MQRLEPLSSTEVSFIFPVGWGMGRGEIKCTGAGEKGNGSAQATLGREQKRRLALPIVPRTHPIFYFPCFLSLFPFSRHFRTEGASAEERGWEPLTKGVGTGSTRYGKWEIQTPCSPPPPHPPLSQKDCF